MKMKTEAVLSVLVLVALTGTETALSKKKFIHVNEEKTWKEAQTYCRENYKDLATIKNIWDLFYFSYKVPRHKVAWTGLRRNESTQQFTDWSDGSSADYGGWHDGSWADNTENCMSLKWWGYAKPCSTQLTFICYYWEMPDLVVVQEMKTWEEALMFCRNNYSELITLDAEIDHDSVNVKNNEIQTPSFWAGLRFLDGSWFWVDQTSIDEQISANLNAMPSCPTRFRCGARRKDSNVLENRDCDEKMNFVCSKYEEKESWSWWR